MKTLKSLKNYQEEKTELTLIFVVVFCYYQAELWAQSDQLNNLCFFKDSSCRVRIQASC